MKFLVVLALIAMAMAEPEADPQFYGHHPFAYTHNGYYPNNYVVGGYPTYSYPYTYNTYGKREAEAEPEADPALIYTTNTLPLTSAVHHSPLVSPLVSTTGVHQPIIYNSAVQTPVVYKSIPVADEKVAAPVVYTHALPVHKPVVYNSAMQTPLTYTVPRVYNTALTTPVLSKVFPSLKTLTTTPVVSHIAKREAEAEADPALVYTAGLHQPIVYNTPVQTPIVYNSAVHTPVVYKTAVHTPLLKTVDNAVVPTLGGFIHSSHVGVCTNNLGIRVPC